MHDALSPEGQRQDLNQEAESRAQLPPPWVLVTRGGWRGEAWLFSGDQNITIIIILFLNAGHCSKHLLYPKHSTHTKGVLSSSPPFKEVPPKVPRG